LEELRKGNPSIQEVNAADGLGEYEIVDDIPVLIISKERDEINDVHIDMTYRFKGKDNCNFKDFRIE